MDNRTLLIGAVVVALAVAVAGYFYWYANEVPAPSVPGATTTEPAKPK